MTLLTAATIDPMLLSDHNPISMTLTFSLSQAHLPIWCLDNSLLTDLDITQKITTYLTQYFQENDSADVSPATLWAAHKCVIQGELISLAAKRRKARKAHIKDLSKRIYSLEKIHKQTLATKSLADLVKAREELLEELGKTLKRKFALHKQIQTK